jgi:hypothetical protein
MATVTPVLPDFPPSVAVIVAAPDVTAVTSPADDTVATVEFEDCHVA